MPGGDLREEREWGGSRFAYATVLLATAASLLVPAARASAATISVSGGTISFAASAGEANILGIDESRDRTVYTFTDEGAPITPVTPGCGNLGPNTVLCAVPGLERLEVDLGNLDDRVTIYGTVTTPQQVVLVGGSGSDILAGAPGAPNTISGDFDTPAVGPPGGNDVIYGGSLDDRISGGGGNDTAFGNDGNDLFLAGTGVDGSDYFSGGTGADTFSYELRDAPVNLSDDGVPNDGDGCTSGPGSGCEADNVAPDVERLVGGNANDQITGMGSANEIWGGAGGDSILGLAGPDMLSGGPGDDLVLGGSGDDTIRGDAGADTVFGGRGADKFLTTPVDDGPDDIHGNRGTDLMDYSAAPEAVRVTVGDRSNDGVRGEFDNVRSDVENVRGTAYADLLIGSRRRNELLGGAGSDQLIGGAGDDRLSGSSGRDRIAARDGGPDRVSCGSSRDRVQADRFDQTSPDCEKVFRR
jgi:Ca2+-binding RTX toxin-like protein